MNNIVELGIAATCLRVAVYVVNAEFCWETLETVDIVKGADVVICTVIPVVLN